MPDKTTRLTALLPEVYAARFGAGVLYRLLDAVGVELADADAAVKRLLTSHWVDYADGDGLDALAATFGQRRRIIDGAPESDESLRQRLRALVAGFTGGGTVAAVKSAVRSALGLPLDLGDLLLPLDSPLVEAVDALVDLTEFSPETAVARQTASSVRLDDNRSRLDLVVDLPSVQPDRPVIELTVTSGVARNISVQLDGTDLGLRAQPQLAVRQGETLVLETVLGGFAARVTGPSGQRSVGYLFADLGGGPAEVPLVPVGASTWVFRAGSGFTGASRLERWSASTRTRSTYRLRREPVLDGLHAADLRRHRAVLPGRGSRAPRPAVRLHPPDLHPPGAAARAGPGCRRRRRAAGVRGRVRFSVGLPVEGADRHDVTERLARSAAVRRQGRSTWRKRCRSAASAPSSRYTTRTRPCGSAGVFDVSTFDDGTGGSSVEDEGGGR